MKVRDAASAMDVPVSVGKMGSLMAEARSGALPVRGKMDKSTTMNPEATVAIRIP